MRPLGSWAVLVLAFCVVPSTSGGTGQVPDYLIYEGKLLWLFSNPLEKHDQFKWVRRLSIAEVSTAERRGYRALWEISDGKLYLVALAAKIDDREIGIFELRKEIEKLFPRTPKNDRDPFPIVKNRVFAGWYSGKLRVPLGEELKYVHQNYESVYERDLFLDIERGVLKKSEIVNNDKPKENDGPDIEHRQDKQKDNQRSAPNGG